MPSGSQIVSFDDEPLVCVDEQDRALNYLDKAACHDGAGVLHRAFSIFLFNSQGELLLQQRSQSKRLWPMWWSNSACSHPRRGETLEAAIERRSHEELAITTPLHFTHKFIYHAPYLDAGSEHELCHVYVGVCDGAHKVNSNEVAALDWVDAEEIDRRLQDANAPYTPWLRLEWAELRAKHWPTIERLVAQASGKHQNG